MTVAEHHADLHARDPIVLAYKASQYWFEATAIPAVTAAATVLPPPITAAAAGLILGPRPLRALLTDLWHSGPIRRRWTKAVIESGAVDPPKDRSREARSYVGPRPHLRVRRTPLGEQFVVEGGTSYMAFTPEVMARLSKIHKSGPVRLEVDPPDLRKKGRMNEAIARITIERYDPFVSYPPFRWPLQDVRETSVWDPMPFAVDEHHEPIVIDTMGGHVLIGGSTGSGKSASLHQFVSTIALDPKAHLILLDNKLVELQRWAPCGTFIGNDMGAAVAALERLNKIIDARYAAIATGKGRKAGRDDDTYHVVIDEGSWYFNYRNEDDPDADDLRKRFNGLYQDIIQRGRAAGVRLILSMQRPSERQLATDIRAQFGFRIAFRTDSPETTKMILATRDAPADKIPASKIDGVGTHAGVCYFELEGGGTAQKARSYYQTEDDIDAIVRRASGVTGDLLADEITASGILDAAPEPQAPPENPVPPPVTPRNAQPATPAPPAAPEPLEQPLAPEKATVTEPAGAFTPQDVANVHLALHEHRDAWTRANPGQDPTDYPGARRDELQRIMVDQRRLSRGWWKAISAGVTDGTIPRTGRPGRGSRKGEGGWRYHPPREDQT